MGSKTNAGREYPPSPIAKLLREARAAKGHSQWQAAEYLEKEIGRRLEQVMISEWERSSRIPDDASLIAIAAYVGRPPEELEAMRAEYEKIRKAWRRDGQKLSGANAALSRMKKREKPEAKVGNGVPVTSQEIAVAAPQTRRDVRTAAAVGAGSALGAVCLDCGKPAVETIEIVGKKTPVCSAKCASAIETRRKIPAKRVETKTDQMDEYRAMREIDRMFVGLDRDERERVVLHIRTRWGL